MIGFNRSPGLIALVLIVVEVLIVSVSFDSATLDTHNRGILATPLQYAGVLIQWSAVFAGAYLLVFLIGKRESHSDERASACKGSPLLALIPVNLVAFAIFYWLTQQIFTDLPISNQTFWLLVSGWLASGLVVAITIAGIALPFRQWAKLLVDNRSHLLLCALVATLVTVTSLISKNLWPAFIYPTFAASEWLLSLIGPVIASPANLHLGIDLFIVHISAQCSGVEGMGLAVSFTLLYLFMIRDNLRFPHALLLIPLAAALSWLLNVVRITVLIILGEYVSADFAVGGFHSQAGWFTFIGLALIIIYCFDRIHWFRKPASMAATETPASAPIRRDTASAILICFVAFLLGALVSGLSENAMNWLYPVKALAGGLAVVYLWRALDISPPLHVAESIGYGLLVLLLWVLMIPADAEFNASLSAELAAAGMGLQILWIAIRVVGSVAVAPIIEELVFRSYLFSRISGQPIEHHRPMAFHLLAIVVSSIAFGAIHNQWLAGTAAGVVYAIARYRGNLASAIVAHTTTNACLCVYAIGFSEWSYL